jgi:DNA-3-methyladenine glycosylase I
MTSQSDAPSRCSWSTGSDLMMAYHDEEWGVPERDDRALFEKLILDGFQAGLSWSTILNKRENFRRAFDDFEPEKIARYTPKKLEKLMGDAGIIRNRSKIESSVTSAQAWLDIMEAGPGSFADLLWQFTDGEPLRNKWKTWKQIPAETPESKAMSKELKARGFRFCGPTICYAFMQAVGMVNDHVVTCFRHHEL